MRLRIVALKSAHSWSDRCLRTDSGNGSRTRFGSHDQARWCRFLPEPDVKEIGRLWRFLMIERETWVAGGIVITVWNAWVYEFPTKSGLKVILGTSTFGVFGATLRALDIGRNTILTLPVVSQD